MTNYFCKNYSGSFGISIEDWNKGENENQYLLVDETPICKRQCIECIKIVSQTRMKNKKIRELQKQNTIGYKKE